MSSKDNLIKNIISNKKVGDPEKVKIQNMANWWMLCLQQYTGNKWLKLPKNERGQYSSNIVNVLKYACDLAEILDVSYETYVKAHFYCADTWYRRAAKFRELACKTTKVPSAKRVKLYLEAVNNGKVKLNRNVVSSSQPTAKIPDEVKAAYAQDQMKLFIQNWDLEDEAAVFKVLKNSAHLYFDTNWLANNQTYQQLLASGQLK